MKRRDLIAELQGAGCRLARHDVYENPSNGRKAPVPRHAEIKDTLCDLIRKQLGVA